MRASVIVPAYNAARTVQGCMHALLAQTYPREWYEILVVDDGSTDQTAALAERIPGVRVLRCLHRGAAAARNEGGRAARGEIVLFTDADCEPMPNWIEAMLAPFSAMEGEPVAGAKGIYRTRQRGWVARFVQLEYEEKYARLSRERAIDFVDTYSAAYPRELFLTHGGFDESFPAASVEDQEFSFRLAEQGCRLVFVPDAVVYHQHVTTLRAYAVRKFRIGYWKVRVHRRHPGKAVRDSHTPPTLKLQIAFLFAFVVSLLALPFAPFASGACFISLAAFVFTMLPLLAFVVRRDRVVGLIAPAMMGVRAAALGAGLVAGVWGEIGRGGGIKRGFDIAGALLGLVLTLPLWPFIALAIRLDSPGPVFFTQIRAGQDGRPFRIFKFRSMVEGAEKMLDQVIAQNCLPPPVFKIPHDPRVTRVGRFLRRSSLDELPQFLNVLKGEMSLVGPRPEELRIVALYDGWHRKRLAVKPGMTGPMQIHGRGALSLDQRVRVELDYIEHHSFWQDLRVLVLTVPALLAGRGAF